MNDVTGRKGNFELTVYGDCWRMRMLDRLAKLLGILIHVDGYPFGWPRQKPEPVACDPLCGSIPMVNNKVPIAKRVVSLRIVRLNNHKPIIPVNDGL
jgi:hypothetical protein